MTQPEPVDMEELKRRSLRAAEVLEGAGWVFDEFIRDETRALLGTPPHASEARERSYNLICATAEVKARLIGIVQNYDAEVTLGNRRTQS